MRIRAKSHYAHERKTRHKSYYRSQYKTQNARTAKHRHRNVQFKSTGLYPSSQRTSRYTKKIIGSLAHAGVMEKKVKVISERTIVARHIATGNPRLQTMSGVVFNFNDPINVADNNVLSGIDSSSVVSMGAFTLLRSPGAAVPGGSVLDPNIANNLVGRQMYCKKVRFTITIQLIPDVATSLPISLNNPGAQFLVPWVFRCITLRKRPRAFGNLGTDSPPRIDTNLILPWAGSMTNKGLVNSEPATGETAQLTPVELLYRKINFKNYSVVKDFNFKMGCPTALGQATNVQSVGFKTINLEFNINQALEYNMNIDPGSATNPASSNCDYCTFIFCGTPGLNFQDTQQSTPALQPTTAAQWRATVQGHMVFIDS